MRFLFKKSAAAALAAVFLYLPVAQAADFGSLPEANLAAGALSAMPAPVQPDAGFETINALPAAGRSPLASRLIAVEVDLANSPFYSLEPADGQLEARYRMNFNNVAEGWNWYPLANPAQEDYYHTKFLPLKSVTVERGDYEHEDKIGEAQRMKVTWRYDYFLAFDNLYDFYPRVADDDAGFVAMLPAGVMTPGQGAPQVRMLALASLVEPYVSESTTFWKATYGKPTDFTLKKRYLMARLEAVWFVDAVSGKVLARLARKTAP